MKIKLKNIALINLIGGVLIAIMAPAVGVLRVLGQFWAGHYHKVIIPILTINSLLGLYYLLQKKKIKLDSLSVFLIIFFFNGIIIGLFNGPSIRYFISHFLGMLFMMSIYIYSINSKNYLELSTINFKKISYYILYSSLFFVIIFWLLKTFYNPSLYMGVGVSYLVFSLAYFVVNKKHGLSFTCLILLFLTGKRGPILAGLVLVIFYYMIPFLKLKLFRSLKYILFFSFSIMISVFTLSYYFGDLFEISILSLPLNKILLVNPFSADFNPDLAFSGRNIELEIAFNKFNSENIYQLFGLGYGWSYFFDVPVVGSSSVDFYVHYVHFGPLNFLLQYGWILFSPFILIFLYKIFKLYIKNILFKVNNFSLIIGLYLIADFTNSLSGYMYPVNPMFWFFLAYASNFSLIKIKK